MEKKTEDEEARRRKLWAVWVDSVQNIDGIDVCMFASHAGAIYSQSKESSFDASNVQSVMGAFKSGGVGKVKLLSRDFLIINNTGGEKKVEEKGCDTLLLKRLGDDLLVTKGKSTPAIAVKTDSIVLVAIGKPGVNPNILCAVQPFQEKLSNDLMKKMLGVK